MKAIEETLSVVAPEVCGFGAFVDKDFRPVCPVGHALFYYGESLKTIFKRKYPTLLRKVAQILVVSEKALSEFISAWDFLVENGTEKKEAFDKALTAAEKVEEADKNRREELQKLREEINSPLYVNILGKIKLPEHVVGWKDSFLLTLDQKDGWKFAETVKLEEICNS